MGMLVSLDGRVVSEGGCVLWLGGSGVFGDSAF